MAARGSCEKNGSTASDPACAQAMRTYPWGEDTPTCSYAVMADGSGAGCGTNATWAVGSLPAGDSPYGLHDMAGNVWEWTRDWYGATYYGSSPTADPVNAAIGKDRPDRGGSFFGVAVPLRARYRDYRDPSVVADGAIGFRCSRAWP